MSFMIVYEWDTARKMFKEEQNDLDSHGFHIYLAVSQCRHVDVAHLVHVGVIV